jgi:hypothetical protein
MYKLLTVIEEPETQERDSRAGRHLEFLYDGYKYAISKKDIQHVGILSGISSQMPMESKNIFWSTGAYVQCVDLRNSILNNRHDNLAYLFVGRGETPSAALLVNSPEPAMFESKIVRDVPTSRRRRKRVGLTPYLSGIAQVNNYEDVGLIDVNLLLEARRIPSRPMTTADDKKKTFPAVPKI